MINLIADRKFKELGCRWHYGEWVPPKLAKKEAQEIHRTFYEDLIGVEVTVCEGHELDGVDWCGRHVRTVAGYVVATARGRDSGAEISEGVAVIKGKFTSGGSSKNYSCQHTDELTIRLEVSRNALHILDEEALAGDYTYCALETIDEKEMLLFRKNELLKELEKINEILSN